MRYYWGLGVGHLHAHQPATTPASTDSPEEGPDDIHHSTEHGPDTLEADMDITQTQIDDSDLGSDSNCSGSSNSDIELDDSSLGGDEDVAEEEDFRGM
jgi:hypothetical protein